MPLYIRHPDADRLARELAASTGETLTDAIINALRERLVRQRGRVRSTALAHDIRAIRRRCAALPVVDARSVDDILGYGTDGIPR